MSDRNDAPHESTRDGTPDAAPARRGARTSAGAGASGAAAAAAVAVPPVPPGLDAVRPQLVIATDRDPARGEDPAPLRPARVRTHARRERDPSGDAPPHAPAARRPHRGAS